MFKILLSTLYFASFDMVLIALLVTYFLNPYSSHFLIIWKWNLTLISKHDNSWVYFKWLKSNGFIMYINLKPSQDKKKKTFKESNRKPGAQFWHLMSFPNRQYSKTTCSHFVLTWNVSHMVFFFEFSVHFPPCIDF